MWLACWSESWGRTEHCRASWAPHKHSQALGFRLSSCWRLDSALPLLLQCVTAAVHPECFPLQDPVPPGDPAEKVNEFWPGHPKSREQQDLRANRHEVVDGFYVLCLSQLAACRVLAGESQPSVSRDYRNKVGGIQTVGV